MRGVGAATVRTYMRGGGPLVDAVSNVTGKKGAHLLDSEHPAFLTWLDSRGPGPERKTPRNLTAERIKLAEMSEDEVGELADIVQELTNKYGQYDEVYQWAKVRKELAMANTAELKRDEHQGRLIRRDFVATHVMGLVDGMCRRLLTETSHVVAKRLGEKSRSGAELPELKAIAVDLIGSTIAQTKREILRNLDTGEPTPRGDDEET